MPLMVHNDCRPFAVQVAGHCVHPRKLSVWDFLFDSFFGRGLTSGTPMRAHSEHRRLLHTVGRLSLVVMLLSILAPQAHAGFPHHDNAHKEVEALELDWRAAQLDNNVSAVDRLLADDYLGINANGTLETKADELARRRSGTLHITQLELSDIKVRIYGDTAVVTSKAELVGKSGDRDISGRYRYTRVYSNRDGQWRIVSFEASRVSGEDGKR
jgi:ketosteroid isomerase-like protein